MHAASFRFQFKLAVLLRPLFTWTCDFHEARQRSNQQTVICSALTHFWLRECICASLVMHEKRGDCDTAESFAYSQSSQCITLMPASYVLHACTQLLDMPWLPTYQPISQLTQVACKICCNDTLASSIIDAVNAWGYQPGGIADSQTISNSSRVCAVTIANCRVSQQCPQLSLGLSGALQGLCPIVLHPRAHPEGLPLARLLPEQAALSSSALLSTVKQVSADGSRVSSSSHDAHRLFEHVTQSCS